MAKILIVHGISNQYRGEMQLRTAWYPALCDGLNRVHHKRLPEPGECSCPFYGDLFRPGAPLGGSVLDDLTDADDLSEDEAALLEAVWRSAAATDAEVPGPDEYSETLFRSPRCVERALNALAKSHYLGDLIPLQFFGDLKQVVLYLNDRALHSKILDRVLEHIVADTTIVIGHSLGSVVAYEAVCAKPGRVSTLISLGSPLGIRNVIFDKLTPSPKPGALGGWPGRVQSWTNVAARGDIVASQKELAPLFGERVQDVLIESGWQAHDSVRYLNAAQTGEAIARELSTTVEI